MDLTVTRDDYRPDRTFGKWTATATGLYVCESIEPGRDHNRASTKTRAGACIPGGPPAAPLLYICRLVWSPTFRMNVYEVTGVPGRLLIRIHPANWSSQLRGCIATGLTRAVIDDKNPDTADDSGVTSSKVAFKKLMALNAGLDRWTLTVIDSTPEAP